MRFLLCFFALLLLARTARADDGLRLESVDVALTAYEQNGRGFQSKAGPLLGRGSQRLTVFEPQILVLARQSSRITHRLWVPIDMVTAASSNALDKYRKRPNGTPDVMSNASRQNQAVTLDWTATYEVPRSFSASMRNNVHVEENFRSFGTGVATTLSLADDNATLAANANQIFDWFSAYDGVGRKQGRVTRSTTNGNVGITQILGPDTIVHANYGLSAQYGELSNTWNTVPRLQPGRADRISERVPDQRIRHALVGRFAQYLPWQGTLKGFYRFYADDWGVVAHALEGQLYQRFTSFLFVRGSYRYYRQTAVDFFTTVVDLGARTFTADSDLGRFSSHTAGFKVSAEVPQIFRGAHVDVGYDHFWRTDGLKVNIGFLQTGARF